MNLILIAPPAAGKGTISKYISDNNLKQLRVNFDNYSFYPKKGEELKCIILMNIQKDILI